MAPRPTWSSLKTQAFPPKPTFTVSNVPNLTGKVYIVTGANTGVGKELAQMLYTKNATVYLLSRSQSKTNQAIEDIRRAVPKSTGRLEFIPLDLGDLSTIKQSVSQFTSREQKLHVLFNNAGIQTLGPPRTTAQGYEQHIGVNVLGTFLLTKLLTPTLISTAKTEPLGTVRVVWVSSSGTEIAGEASKGLSFDKWDEYNKRSAMERYGLSKAGNWLHGVEYARRHKADGIVSIPLNPGNLSSELYREHGRLFRMILGTFTYPPINGAYTELFAGLSPAVTLEKTGSWVVPFGRFWPIRQDLLETRPEEEGGNGHAVRFWEWSENEVKKYA